MKVHGIIRVSSLTPEAQQIEQATKAIKDWAAKRPNDEIVWYVDKNVSAVKMKMADRPEAGKALKAAKAGDVIVTNKLDRAWRNTMDCLTTAQECQERGIDLAITTMDIDTTTASGKLVLTMLVALAQFEAEQIAERARDAYQTFLREGRHWGDKPYGFHSVPHPSGKGLVIRPITESGPCEHCRVKEQDPESEKWVDTEEPLEHYAEGLLLRDAVLEYANGSVTQAELAKHLGLPEASFRKLLSNVRLYGQTPGKNGKHDPNAGIISRAEFQAIQQRLGGPRQWSRTDCYARIFKCSTCKGPLYFDKHGDFYRCEGKPEHKGRVTVNRKVADTYLENHFLETFGLAQMQEIIPADDTEQRERLAEIEMESSELKARIGTGSDEEDESIFARLRELKAYREEAEMWDVPRDTKYREVGWTVAQHFNGSDTKGRLALLEQTLRVKVYPFKERRGLERFDPEHLQEPGSAIGFSWSLDQEDTLAVL